jgi:RNA polymerase sigma-70 factor (ECF subfamily)
VTRDGLQRFRARGVLEAVQGATADSEDELCRRLAGDLDAGFAELVATYGSLVCTVAARATFGNEETEDLAAEAFLRAYRALRGYDAARIRELRLRPWLVTIALNVARNARRAASRHPRADSLAVTGEPVARGRDVAELAETADAAGELAKRLAALPAKQRLAVVLRYVADLPVPEIAAVMACPEGTARSHVARGLAALRAAYGADRTSQARPAGRRGGQEPDR